MEVGRIGLRARDFIPAYVERSELAEGRCLDLDQSFASTFIEGEHVVAQAIAESRGHVLDAIGKPRPASRMQATGFEFGDRGGISRPRQRRPRSGATDRFDPMRIATLGFRCCATTHQIEQAQNILAGHGLADPGVDDRMRRTQSRVFGIAADDREVWPVPGAC